MQHIFSLIHAHRTPSNSSHSIYESVEDTKLSTNKQHTLSHTTSTHVLEVGDACLEDQGSLVNTYYTFDLCRPRGRARPTSASCDRSVFALTRRGACIDLPGFGRTTATCLTRKMQGFQGQAPAGHPRPSTPPDTRSPRMIHTMGFLGALSIEDVLKSVLLATLKDSPTRTLRPRTSPRCSGRSNCLRWSRSCTRGRSRRITPLEQN